MNQTNRLGLPLLAAGQAQKEIAHNEALLRIDMLAQGAALSADLATPPDTPSAGECWIVAASATGDWADMDGEIAGWSEGGWRFVRPRQGWRMWVMDRTRTMRFDGTNWIDDPVRSDGYDVEGQQVLGMRQAAIADPSGGTTIDAEARTALLAMLAAMRAHGLIDI